VVSWFAVDTAGCDLRTGGAPVPPGAPTPSAALATTPVATWPATVVGSDGRRLALAGALGEGGARVERLVGRLLSPPTPVPEGGVEALARATPLGPLDGPVDVLALSDAVEAAGSIDATWLDGLDERRRAPRSALVEGGRSIELQAALHVVMLLATAQLDPAIDDDVDAHVASGAQLWLLGAAVAWCLAAGPGRDPFAAWAELVVRGWWPVGPCQGRLVVAATRARAA